MRRRAERAQRVDKRRLVVAFVPPQPSCTPAGGAATNATAARVPRCRVRAGTTPRPPPARTDARSGLRPIRPAWPRAPSPSGTDDCRGRSSIDASDSSGVHRENSPWDYPDHRTAPGRSLPRKLFRPAHASSNVPSTVKCSSDSTLRPRAALSRPQRTRRAMSPSSSRSRFLVNVVEVHTRIVHVPARQTTGTTGLCQLFHQQPFAPHRIENLQQQRPQQFLRRHRRPPDPGVQPSKRGDNRASAASVIRRITAQRMVRRHSLGRARGN